jgi:hypothetical protein
MRVDAPEEGGEEDQSNSSRLESEHDGKFAEVEIMSSFVSSPWWQFLFARVPLLRMTRTQKRH